MMLPSTNRSTAYLWLCVAMSSVVFVGFWFTYFSPMLAGTYPPSSGTVHVHGWSFFLWYLLLPLQAGLVVSRRIALHRLMGLASISLAVLMVATGCVVIGMQMELARQPEGNPFWKALGLAVFATLLLFSGFYALAVTFRKTRALHKRFIVLASAGALGAAAFRVVAQVIGFGIPAGIIGVLATNLFVVTAIVIDIKRGEGVHLVYRVGLPVSLALEAGAIWFTPTAAGQHIAGVMASMGRLLAPLY